MSSRKKLLILIDWFVPGYRAGGPVQSCVNICRLLHHQYDIYVLTTDTDHGEKTAYAGIIKNEWIKNEALGINIFYAAKKTISKTQIKNQILFVNPDTVYLNLLFSPYFSVYPLWLKYKGIIKSKVVLCPRGTLYESALNVKRYKKTPFLFLISKMGIAKSILFHATNEREKQAVLHHFPGSRITIANNLPDTYQPPFVSIQKQAGYLKCIFIARIVPIKNLLYFLNVLMEVNHQVDFSIVGPAENSAYWNDCKKQINQLPENIKIQYLGPKSNDELKALVQQHHLFVLPTLGENFGHAIFEALLCGRPVLISDQTPWRNLQLNNAGWDIPLNDPSVFVKTMNELAACNQQQFDQNAIAAWQYAHGFIINPDLAKPYQTLFE